MPSYKLRYFDLRARAEPIRMLLTMAGQKFEDERFGFAEWPALMGTTPFGHVPVLEVDGTPIPQTNAILRYLAREYGYASATPIEQAQTDAFADQIADLMTEITPWLKVTLGYVEGDEEKLRKELFDPVFSRNAAIFEKFLSKSGSGWLVGDSLTYADLHVACMMYCLGDVVREKGDEKLFKEYPRLEAHMNKVHWDARLSDYVATRQGNRY